MTCPNCGKKKRKIALGCTRVSCLECTEKHLGAAYVLLAETRNGWPYRLMAIGHLHEAEDESQEFAVLHEFIRASRKAYQTKDIQPDWFEIQEKINLLRKEFGIMAEELKPDEKTALVTQAKQGVNALNALKEKGAEDVFLEPGTWLVLVELIKSLLGIFGLGRDKEIDATTLTNFNTLISNQEKMITLEEEKNNKLKAIYDHLEKTCLSEEKAKELFDNLKSEVAEESSTLTAQKIPGEMMRMKLGFTRDD